MINRLLKAILITIAKKMPIVTITGPRQSGKTTLVKATFPNYTYTNLEFPDTRQFAKEDPRGFLQSLGKNAIIDEVQNSPDILSYIQGITDQENRPGQYILTGSQNLLLLENISQSLAGRTAVLHLLPLSLKEMFSNGYKHEIYEEWIFKGFYPRIYDRNLLQNEWFPAYIETYIERDIRSIINIKDLTQFQNFLKLCAGRIGQVVNFASLGNDAGIDQKTVKRWLSILETTFTIFLLQPYYKNFNKRVIKAPKLYFHDIGLASFLLGIRSCDEVESHYLRGGLFENMVISELFKNRINRGLRPDFYYWRDSNGNEVDIITEEKDTINGIEIKSGKTINTDFFKGLKYLKKTADDKFNSGSIIYGGDAEQIRSDTSIFPWYKITEFLI